MANIASLALSRSCTTSLWTKKRAKLRELDVWDCLGCEDDRACLGVLAVWDLLSSLASEPTLVSIRLSAWELIHSVYMGKQLPRKLEPDLGNEFGVAEP